MPDRPTFADVRDALARRKKALSGMHTDMQADEDLHYWSGDTQQQVRNGLNALKGLPAGFEPRFPPFAYEGVMVGLNRISAGDAPEVNIRLSDESGQDPESESTRRRIDTMNKWANAWLYTVATFSTENPLRDLPMKQLKMGAGALSYAIDYEAWPDYPLGTKIDDRGQRVPKREPKNRAETRAVEKWQQKRKGAFPWKVVSLSPVALYFDTDRDPPRDYIIEDEVSGREAVACYPHLEGQVDEKAEKLKRIQYCAEDWYGIWIHERACLTAEDAAVDGVAPNSYGRPWIRMAWSGWGDSSSTNDWAKKGAGVLRHGRAIVLELCEAWNEMRALGLTQAFPGTELIGPDDETAVLMQQLDAGPAAINRHTANVQMRWRESPTTPDIVLKRYEVAKEQYSDHFGEPVLKGAPRSEPAASQRARSTSASLPFEVTQVSDQQLVSGMLTDIFGMVKNHLREPVTVRGVTLRPEDIIEEVIIDTNYTPLTDEEKSFKRADAERDLKNGAITLEEYIRTVRGVEDGAQVLRAVRKEKLTEAILADPQVLALGVQKLLQSLGVPPAPAPTGAPLPPGAGAGAPPQPGPGQAPEPPPQPMPMAGGPYEAQQQVDSIYAAPLLTGMPG